MEDWVKVTRKGFDIIRDGMDRTEIYPKTHHLDSDIVTQLFALVMGAIKATKAEKILLNIETVALHLALHINVRGSAITLHVSLM